MAHQKASGSARFSPVVPSLARHRPASGPFLKRRWSIVRGRRTLQLVTARTRPEDEGEVVAMAARKAAVAPGTALFALPVGAPIAPRISTRRAADGPATTLVVDLCADGRLLPPEEALIALAESRAAAMARDPKLGAKTIGVLRCAESEIELLFVQGDGDRLDPLSEVCLNSSVCAVEVARETWGLLSAGPVTVRVGPVTFTITEVAA
jgi:hypothetical protein